MILPSLVFVFCLPHTFENVTSFCLFIDFFKLAGSLWHSLMNVFLFVSPLVTILRDNVTVDSIATFLVPTSKLKGFSASLISTITLLRLSYNFLILPYFRYDDTSSFFVNPSASNTWLTNDILIKWEFIHVCLAPVEIVIGYVQFFDLHHHHW